MGSPEFHICAVADSEDKKRVIVQCDDAFADPAVRRSVFGSLFAKIDASAEFLAAYTHEPMGYIALYANDTQDHIAYITLLAVKPPYQSRHVGSALLDAGIRLAAEKGMKYVRLEVNAANAGAIRLYERKGFAKQANTPNGSIYMLKRLSC